MAITNISLQIPANTKLYTDTALGTSIDAIKASSTTVYQIVADNSLNGAASYVKLFNLAGGSVTAGSSVPDQVLYIPASSVVSFQFTTSASPGLIFNTALSMFACTTGGTVGSTPPSSNLTVGVMYV